VAQLSTLDLMPMPLVNPEAVSDLIRWDTPFAIGLDPSVRFITETPDSDAILIVAPGGLGAYPQFLVRFGRVVTLLCYEETCAIDRGFRELIRSEYDLCSYRWTTSPWLKHYRVLEDFLFTNTPEKLHHYVLFGGDSIVEVIALGEPQIERVDQKMTIEVKYEV